MKRSKGYREKMERHLGRKLKSNEHVHHKNGRRSDNRLSNLQVLSASAHSRLHWEERQRPICEACDRVARKVKQGRPGKRDRDIQSRELLNRRYRRVFVPRLGGFRGRFIMKRADVRERHHKRLADALSRHVPGYKCSAVAAQEVENG